MTVILSKYLSQRLQPNIVQQIVQIVQHTKSINSHLIFNTKQWYTTHSNIFLWFFQQRSAKQTELATRGNKIYDSKII